jgi:hypothetical protein
MRRRGNMIIYKSSLERTFIKRTSLSRSWKISKNNPAPYIWLLLPLKANSIKY